MFELDVSRFYRAGFALVTSAICLAFLSLIGFVLWKGGISLEIVLFCSIIALLVAWFGKLSYRAIFRDEKQGGNLLSPFSIICIFSLVGAGVFAGTIYRFSTGNPEKGLFAILLLILLIPAGHYCWKLAKKNSHKPHN
ncbi:hypothetical protein [Flavobacterium sp. W21_SRS_FM6]|uniref:hypothetical protein n=1 Tax=Flavobacterium sp. W21_SRS_FM6 TaxID=3240268 RepID=UPI003F90E820